MSDHHRELLAQGQLSFVFTFGHIDDVYPGVYRSPGLPMGNSPFRVSFTLDLASSRATNKLDVLHVHEPFAIANIALHIARRRNRPVIFTNHTRHDTYVKNYPSYLQPPLHLHVANTMARVIRASTLTTTPSEDTARWMRSLVPDIPAERVRVIRNGIRLDPFKNIVEPHRRTEFGISESATILMYVGRLTPEKNLTTLAEAFLAAVASGADIYWLLIGEGKTRPVLETQLAPVRDRIHFLGKIARDEIASYLALADIFVTASQSEVNPVSVIEAMACGKPYIGLAAPWWDEFTKDQAAGASAGILASDTPELAAAIVRLNHDRALLGEMGENARALSEVFNIRSVASQWIEVYQQVAETAP